MKTLTVPLLSILLCSCSITQQNGYYQSRKYKIKKPKIFQKQASKQNNEAVHHFPKPQKITSKQVQFEAIVPMRFDSISIKPEALYTIPSMQIDSPDPVSYDTALYRVKYHPLIIENVNFTLKIYGVLLYYILQSLLIGTIFNPLIVLLPFVVLALYISIFKFFEGLYTLQWLVPRLKGRRLAIGFIILNIFLMSIIMAGLIVIFFV